MSCCLNISVDFTKKLLHHMRKHKNMVHIFTIGHSVTTTVNVVCNIEQTEHWSHLALNHTSKCHLDLNSQHEHHS